MTQQTPADQDIRDDGRESKYFHQIVNMADDDLDVYQYRLYGHYKRVCGASENGVCFPSTRTTAEKCKMSVGKVAQTRRELVELGYIEITAGAKAETFSVTLKDLMAENVQRYSAATARVQDVNAKGSGVHHMNKE